MGSLDLRSIAFQKYPDVTFILAIGFSSYLALGLTPRSEPIILTLTGLLVYSRILFHRAHLFRNLFGLTIVIATGGTFARLSPSLDALSKPAVSVLILFASSLITSMLTISTVYIDTRLWSRLQSPWSRVALFPAIWATLWGVVAWVSPIGRLSTWSPVEGGGLYGWMVPFVGPAGIDWTVAAWAVVLSQTIGMWYMGDGDEDDHPLVTQPAHANTQARQLTAQRSTMLLAVTLVSLSLPSFFITDFPLPTISKETTPLGVGCILPPRYRYKSHSPTFDDYIAESKKHTSSAKILVWPESAVTFKDEKERDAAFKKVRELVTGSFVAVSFEEAFDPEDGSERSSAKRAGVAIVSPSSNTTHLVYYKRHLVPIAESFSLRHSSEPPTIFTLELSHPAGIPKTDWAPGPGHTRPIPISASICLDFAHPLSFAGLPSRPALILAPARTWDPAIGYAMWLQARQRADELGSMVLWCDGGDGGFSGVAGGGFHDFNQVGSGSWVKNIGVQYAFNDHRTPYAFLGYSTILIFWLFVVGTSIGDRVFLIRDGGYIQQGIRRLQAVLRQEPRNRGRTNVVPEGNLLE